MEKGRRGANTAPEKAKIKWDFFCSKWYLYFINNISLQTINLHVWIWGGVGTNPFFFLFINFISRSEREIERKLSIK